MPSHLSHNLPPLRTSGNRIINTITGAPLLLRGINRSGLEYSDPDEQGFLSGASISRAEIYAITQQWRANIIRLPFNQDWVLNGRSGRTAEEYQQALDQVIFWASMFGAYTLLDLQWLDAERIYGGNRNFVAPLPNPESITLWSTLARRYKDEPAVLYDLFNEPHDRLPDDPYPLNKPDGTTYPASQARVTMNEWQPWARKLTEAIRNENPDALIFIGGTNWAYDLRGMPIDDLDNVVYSTHVYPNKGTDWDSVFGDLSESVPVFAGELGGVDTPEELDYVRRLLDYLQQKQIGFAAWSWIDQPNLITRHTPTAFGQLVRQTLTNI
ncbi:glycoside hydrolase family 5 protein [Occallatibacter savannae]|uniref:glycoside hydrolase family 5 protein n=1 Tax=Occallatibacter savannae TaxID=1002691 RepID=UPI000D68F504|nr:cellulase family glycosylhydrolase [Occallatibacter savannae]